MAYTRKNSHGPDKFHKWQDPEIGTARGDVALVTGGSRGMGRAIALRLASPGASVAICGRDGTALAESLDHLEKSGARVFSHATDLTSTSQIAELVAAAETALGPISILVNNAGIGLFGPAHEKTEADWDSVLDTNLKSVFLLSRAVAPSMIRRGAGDIINISSLAGKNTFAGGGIYCASKWGLMGLPAVWRKTSASAASGSVSSARAAVPRDSPAVGQGIRQKFSARKTWPTRWKRSSRQGPGAS